MSSHHARVLSYTPLCKTAFPSPGRVYGNFGRVCKNTVTTIDALALIDIVHVGLSWSQNIIKTCCRYL